MPKKFQTRFDKFMHDKEKGGGGTITEQTYVTTNQQISNMLRAGAVLKAWRAKNVDEVTEPDINPTAKKSFTGIDAAELAQSVNAKLKAQLKARDEAKKADEQRQKAATAAVKDEVKE